MREASIVSIGNEILTGQTVDANAEYLSGKLLSIGIPVVSSYTVADDIDSIVRALKLAGSDADVVLATGGLGPTDDDLTRQAFAKLLGTELQLRNELLQQIQNFFTSRNLQMPPKTKIQAYIPAGAKAIANNLGTAPGIMAELKGKSLFALPGVPSEMKRMFEESVLPELQRFAGRQAVVVRKVKCFGAGESTMVELLGNTMRRDRSPLINCTAECGVITLHIVATAKAEVVGQKLAQHKKTIAVAESCTGGCLAGLLTDIPGASRYFTHGWVTYSDTAKVSELGVPADLIEKHGAVSDQVARAMAKGARKRAQTDFAIAITGIAGPNGGTEQKPVGMVYISMDSDSGCEDRHFIFSHDRACIRLRAARTALNMLRLKLEI